MVKRATIKSEMFSATTRYSSISNLTIQCIVICSEMSLHPDFIYISLYLSFMILTKHFNQWTLSCILHYRESHFKEHASRKTDAGELIVFWGLQVYMHTCLYFRRWGKVGMMQFTVYSQHVCFHTLWYIMYTVVNELFLFCMHAHLHHVLKLRVSKPKASLASLMSGKKKHIWFGEIVWNCQ